MRWIRRLVSAVLLFVIGMAGAQNHDEGLQVYTEHPRLFLRPNRLRLLKRERERRSLRWRQFELLIAGKARMPEPGFAQALYYMVAGDRDAGREAIVWALGPATDLRQLALVYDWCQNLLTLTQSKTLAAKLQQGIEGSARDKRVPAARSRILAAVALAEHLPQVSSREIENLIQNWWRAETVPALRAGRNVIAREDFYALFEMLHAVRDNLEIDLRDSIPKFFKELPVYDVASYYPAIYPAPENEYRIPAQKGAGEPDLRRAALARAAEFCMVAYDNNAVESQILQGWLMHDNFLMRGTFGIPYEFLWANPYQPGLSYYLLPLVYHDPLFGRLFIRSNWEDNAAWLGYFDGQFQLFQDGKITVMNPQLSNVPVTFPDATVVSGAGQRKFHLVLQDSGELFVIGLKPNRLYDIEIDDWEMSEEKTDAGGILTLRLPAKSNVGLRFRESGASLAAQR